MSEAVEKSFNNLWTRFGIATHEDEGFRKFQKEWFLKRFGLTEKELKELLKDKTVIEIGTGSGAFIEVLSTAKEVSGLDISEAGLEIARAMYGDRRNIHLIKSDLMKFTGNYDVVIADQVLHHLPDTFKALEKAVSLIKPEGVIFFYIYTKKTLIREFMDKFWRFFTTRMSVDWCLSFSKLACRIGKTLTRVDVGFQRWFYWNIMKCFWNDDFTYDNNLRVNFDWYHPPIASRHTASEVFEWIKCLDLKTQFVNIGKSGVSVRAVVASRPK